MADMPVAILFHGDFVPKLLVIDTDDTMDGVAAKAREVTIGIHVADQPGRAIRVHKVGNDEPFPRDATVSGVGLEAMDGLDLYFEQ